MAAALPEDEEGIGNQGFWDVVSQLLGKGVDCGACCGPRNGQGERSEYAEAWRLKTDRAAYRSEEDEAFNLWNARYWENRNGEQGADRHGAVPMRASNLPGNANRSKALPHCGNSTTPRGLAQQEVGSRHALEEPGSGPSRFAQDKQNRHMHSAHHALHKAPPEAEHNYLSFLPGEHVEVHRHHHSSVKHHGSDPHAEHHAQDYAHHSDPHPQHHHHNPSSSHHHSPKNNSVHQSQDHGHLTHHTQHSAVAFHGSGGSHGLLHDHSEHHFQVRFQARWMIPNQKIDTDKSNLQTSIMDIMESQVLTITSITPQASGGTQCQRRRVRWSSSWMTCKKQRKMGWSRQDMSE